MRSRLAESQSYGLPSSIVLTLLLLTSCSVAPGDARSGGSIGSTSQAITARDRVAPSSWCAHVLGGAPATKAPLFALSAAHADLRFFGGFATQQEVDLALAGALAKTAVPDATVLSTYVGALAPGEACLAPTQTGALPVASVTALGGGVALVRPGTGSVTLPRGTKAVAIDVRGLPNVTGLRAALESAVSLALANPVPRGMQQLRSSFGCVDAAYGDPIYSDQLEWNPQASIPAAASVDLPLAIVTAGALAPDSAELAATLRLAGRAWLLGADVDVAVAESSWNPVNDEGIAYHRVDLLDPTSGNQWPDAVAADALGSDPVALTLGLATRGAPPAATTSPATRPQLIAWNDVGTPLPATLGPGEARAGLVISHGAMRLFYPYFAEEGDTIDPRLEETLALVDAEVAASANGAMDRMTYQLTLGHFGEALHDGHNVAGDTTFTFQGYLPIHLETIDGAPVVRSTQIPGVAPGDTIVSIDGVPAAEWYAKYEWSNSAATPGYLFQKTTVDWLVTSNGPRTLGLVTLGGAYKKVVAQPISFTAPQTFGFASQRPSGYLGDLGAPDIYFLNLDDFMTPDDPTALAAIAEAQGARGMIVDIRGYPYVGDPTYQALMPAGFSSPGMFIPYLRSPAPSDFTLYDVTYSDPPNTTPPFYTGPLILLVGNATISAADNLSLALVDSGRTKHVVGRQSSGTDGNDSGLQLPGGFTFTFTGMKVTHADGARYEGIGVLPDIPVTLTAKDFAEGRDPEVMAAIGAF